MPQESLDLGIAFLQARELFGVELDVLPVPHELGRRVLNRNGGGGELVGKVGELRIDASHACKLRDGAVERIERGPLPRKRLGGLVGGGSQSLGMLGTGQHLFELFELTWGGIHLLDAVQGETRLLELRPLSPARSLNTLEFALRRTGARQ